MLQLHGEVRVGIELHDIHRCMCRAPLRWNIYHAEIESELTEYHTAARVCISAKQSFKFNTITAKHGKLQKDLN